MEATVPIALASIALFLLVVGALIDDRRARARRLAPAPIELPLLHSINDDRCIGCEACVDACPTEVLELVDHKARVVRFSDCVQCEQCANACPTTALVMYRQGAVPQTLTVPELDDHFQTGVPGQFLIGEVAGKPLVKNAANLGRAVIEHIANELAGRPRTGDLLDVAIVGSGPGGLSAGLTCIKRGLSVVVLEKEHVISSTVSRYPKGKHFMAEPSHAVNRSYLPVFDASKEDLIAAWKRVVEHVKLPIRLGEAVETVKRGDDGIFEIKTTVGTYRARTVVLATGLRGKPRLLAVPGANLEKVQSRLEDPAEFAGQQVLVVGGGDSAVEAAASLVDVGATVTLSYRGDGFKRCKQGNQKRLAELSSAGQLQILLESNVQEFTPDAVAIKKQDGAVVALPNQQAFVLIGADTPVAWLQANSVRFVEREHLYALGSTEDAVLKVAPGAVECPRSPDEAIAALLGAPAHPSHRRERATSHRTGPERSIVRRVRDELHRAVGELTGVFKAPVLEPPRPGRAPTAAPAAGRANAGRATAPLLIPASHLTRPRTPTPAPAPRLFARPTTLGPRSRSETAADSETTVEMMSLPARLRARAVAAAAPRQPTLHPWAEDEVVTSAPAYPPEPPTRVVAIGTRPLPPPRLPRPALPGLPPSASEARPVPPPVGRPAGGAAPARVLRKRMGG